MSNVVHIKGHRRYEKKAKRSAAQTLSLAKKFNCSEVLIIGIDEDGELMVRAHPNDPGGALWLMELAKKHLLDSGS